MPRVGKRHFSYTPAGMRAARKARRQRRAVKRTRGFGGPRTRDAKSAGAVERSAGLPKFATRADKAAGSPVTASPMRKRLRSLRSRPMHKGFRS